MVQEERVAPDGRGGEDERMDLAEIASNPLIGLLAIVGGAAIVHRLARSLLRLGLSAAEKASIEGLLEVSIRNGDLTTMAERREQVGAVRRARGRAFLTSGFWLALLAVPPIAGVATLVYAPAALVWFLPRKPLRLVTIPPPSETKSPEPPA